MFVISHVSVICSSRQLTKVAKVLGRTAIYSVEHSRWLIFTFGVSVLIEMEPMRRYWVWKHMHILQKYVFSPLSMQILVYHVHKSLKETLFFFKISFSKPSNIHIFFCVISFYVHQSSLANTKNSERSTALRWRSISLYLGKQHVPSSWLHLVTVTVTACVKMDDFGISHFSGKEIKSTWCNN